MTEEEMTEILERYNGELLRLCGKRKQEGKDCEGYNKLDEKEIMELKGRCQDLEEKIKENTNEEHS